MRPGCSINVPIWNATRAEAVCFLFYLHVVPFLFVCIIFCTALLINILICNIERAIQEDHVISKTLLKINCLTLTSFFN